MNQFNIERVVDDVRRKLVALERIIHDLEAIWVLVSPYVEWLKSTLGGSPAISS
jgi:hypothetical protein